MITVGIKVSNPADPAKSYQNKFLVDSGAIYSVVPAKELKKIGISPLEEEEFSSADGRIVKRKIGNVMYEYKGIKRAAPVLFGKAGDSLLLGTFTLEALGLTLDPFKRKLYKADLRM